MRFEKSTQRCILDCDTLICFSFSAYLKINHDRYQTEAGQQIYHLRTPPKTTSKPVDTSLVSRAAYIFCKAGDETVFLDLELCFNRTVELTAVEWEPLEGVQKWHFERFILGFEVGRIQSLILQYLHPWTTQRLIDLEQLLQVSCP